MENVLNHLGQYSDKVITPDTILYYTKNIRLN